MWVTYYLQLAIARTDDSPWRRIFLYKVIITQLVNKLPTVYKP